MLSQSPSFTMKPLRASSTAFGLGFGSTDKTTMKGLRMGAKLTLVIFQPSSSGTDTADASSCSNTWPRGQTPT